MQVPEILLLASLILLGIMLILLTTFRCWNWKNRPPGPTPWPFIGNMRTVKSLARKLKGQHFAFLELNRRYRSNIISLRLGGQKFIVVSGQKYIQEVLRNEVFDGRPWNEFFKLRNMGLRKGITLNDGEEWKDMRAWLVRSFRIIGLGKREASDLIENELREILESLKNGGVYCMKPIIGPAIVNVLWTLITGKRLCESTRLQYFIRLMDRRATAFDMAGGWISAFPWIRHIAPEKSGYNMLVKLNNELRDFLVEAIEDHKINYSAGNESDLIDLFLRESRNGEKSDFDENNLLIILMDLLIAGLITTATSLDFLFLNMIVHQDVQENVRREIDAIIGSSRLPQLNDRPKLPYTEAVLTESQRMWTVTPIIGPRRVLQDINFDRYAIEKDTSVLINIYSVNMDPSLYPEPETFSPARFYKDGAFIPDENLILFGKVQRKKGFGPGEQEWGHVTVRKDAHMFWWLYYTTAKVNSYYDRPLVIWLQGGPGASSTSYGNFMELGPLDLNLRKRNYTWVNDYNVLFIDNPVGAGYSYVDASTAYTTNNTQIAADLVACIKGILGKLPKFQKVPTYITSESYGGKMAAEFALQWYRAQISGLVKSNLRGVALGDSWISPIDSVMTWAPFLLSTGMVDSAGFRRIDKSAKLTKAAVERGNWESATSLWGTTENVILTVTENIDFYNILTKVSSYGRQFATLLENSTYNGEKATALRLLPRIDTADLERLMNSQVKRSLNLTVPHTVQSGIVFRYLYEDFMKPVVHVVERLLNETNIGVYVYNGQLDLIVDTPGTLEWVEKLKWSGSSAWLSSPRNAVVANNVIEGYVKAYGNLKMYWINRAGHMVPADNPTAMAKILQDITGNV
ncbi:probable cytochrome P450 305a1 [Prorops nasuta]|uniref:probable cytochrome P450 305a1 n=1 Tax=Prorops nasuta TaxID=863751 RepID=UPI0034CE85CC